MSNSQWTAERGPHFIRIWQELPVRHGVADVCISRGIDENGPSLEEWKRARLITAAPDLLGACENVEKWLFAVFDDDDAENENFNAGFRKALKTVRAAIAKAKGEREHAV